MPMPRAHTLLSATDIAGRAVAGRIVLPHDGRHRRRITMRTDTDLVFLLDLERPAQLRHGDGLLLDDGRIVEVAAAEEPLVEAVARDPQHLARLAWHVGNRHAPAEILADRIRFAHDPVLEDMVRGLGAGVFRISARFEPEGGAYAGGHTHAPAPAHGHAHHDHHHDHAHGEGCGHAHAHDPRA
jgi:urease accessory protein